MIMNTELMQYAQTFEQDVLAYKSKRAIKQYA
jgi:hypothetical protein